MKRILKLADSRGLFYTLVALNFLAAAGIFIAYRGQIGGDYHTYFNLADGIRHGRYSYWWFLTNYVPDTFRNPGYPLFLLIIRGIWDSVLFVQVVQLIFYFGTVILALKILERFGEGFSVKNIFLLLLLPSLQIAISSAIIIPDIFTAFLITLTIYLEGKLSSEKWSKYILLGILYGIIFQLRPSFMFFPFVYYGFYFFVNRKEFNFPKTAILLLVYVITMIPYGIWNYRNNHVFKVTSLEGGGGLMHNAYWSFKMPGKGEDRYWYGNKFSEEIFSFVDSSQIDNNILAYRAEWGKIDSALAKYKSSHLDSVWFDEMLEAWKTRKGLPPTYNARYTQEREKLLMKLTIQHWKDEPAFFIKTRIYSAFRFWITNFQSGDFRKKSFTGKVVACYPFVLTSFTFFLFLILVPWAYFRRRIKLNVTLSFLLLIIYFGLIHLPFGIQARYTIPVRMLLLMLLAISFVKLFEDKSQKTTS